MRTQGSGAIVNCSSDGRTQGPAHPVYLHGVKHAVIGLTKSAAVENAAFGIRVNAVCPGSFETPMLTSMVDRGELKLEDAIGDAPIGRLGDPKELVDTVPWLCSPDRAWWSALFYLWTAALSRGSRSVNKGEAN